MIEMGCAECGRLLRSKDEFAGRRIKCPHCGKSQRTPEAEEAEEQRPVPASKNVPLGWAGLALVGLSGASLFNLSPLGSTMRFRANGLRARTSPGRNSSGSARTPTWPSGPFAPWRESWAGSEV